jgi:phosphonate transport system substrate-binding protein
MASLLRDGKVDLHIDSPFPALAVSRLSGSRFLLRRWKKGVAEYHSVIFVKKDSDLRRLEDLKGKTLTFEEPFSSSGYIFPKMALLQEGLKLVPKTGPSESVGPEEVGYKFSLDDENTMVWVLRGKVVAGATDNHSYSEQSRENLSSLKIIYRTFSFPRHIVSHRADLPPKLVARAKEVLIKMGQSEEGREVLREFERTTKFDELPSEAVSRLLQARKFIDVEIGLR